jgi:hypothetical protein
MNDFQGFLELLVGAHKDCKVVIDDDRNSNKIIYKIGEDYIGFIETNDGCKHNMKGIPFSSIKTIDLIECINRKKESFYELRIYTNESKPYLEKQLTNIEATKELLRNIYLDIRGIKRRMEQD